jgi:hypothetical protein
MNITLYYNDNFQYVTIHNFDDLTSLIELYFDIQPQHQMIKLNEQLINHTTLLKNDDLLVISKNITNTKIPKKPHSLISIIGEYKYQLKMVLDSGAQNNVMSEYLAKFLNLPIDTSKRGVAHGIGTTTIVGNTSCQMKINNQYYNINFNVLQTDIKESTTKYLILLGLDFLYTNDCIISLKHKTISINDQVINLLNEYELEVHNHPIKIETPIESFYRKLNLTMDEHHMLKKILNNIVTNPTEEKYKIININSNTFKKYLSNCMDLLKLSGFVLTEEHLKFTNNVETLENLIEIM